MAKSHTIFALSTYFAPSALAIIRVSGDRSKAVLDKLCKISNVRPRYAYFKEIYDSQKQPIDKCIIIFYKSPESFTGEDLLEIQTHGSLAVIKRLLEELKKHKGLRMAMPGEFSQRAFRNKKQSLLHFEGTNNLIAAETENQRIIALKQTLGESQNICEKWRTVILESLATVDAFIEFSDEDKIDLIKINKTLSSVVSEIENSITRAKYFEKIRSGIQILIFGPPNAGKSSLFNIICNDEKAIVSPVEGTTRDQIVSTTEFLGKRVDFIDSAGVRISNNIIEKKGIFKTNESLKKLSKFILVLSSDSIKKTNIKAISEAVKKVHRRDLVIVFNKSDLKNSLEINKQWKQKISLLKNYSSISISCKKKKLDLNILNKLSNFLNKNLINVDSTSNDDYFFTEMRHIECLERILLELNNSILNLKFPELCSEHLKFALMVTDELYGNTMDDEKLGIIFKKFCIGK